MNTIDLKAEVSRAIRSEWPAFEQAHPRLAAVIDQSLLAEQAAASLADDPEYQRVMNEITTLGPALDIARDLIGRLVGTLIRSLT